MSADASRDLAAGYRIHAPVSRTGRSVAPTSSAGIDFPSWDTSPTVSDQLVGCDELPEALASRIWRTACHTVSSLGMRRPDALQAGWGGPWGHGGARYQLSAPYLRNVTCGCPSPANAHCLPPLLPIHDLIARFSLLVNGRQGMY